MEWSYPTIAGKTPLQYRFEFALWTLDLVRWLIGERFGIRLSKTSTWRVMNQMGLSSQRPPWRALEQDAGAAERWNREEYPESQALAKTDTASLWSGDERSLGTGFDPLLALQMVFAMLYVAWTAGSDEFETFAA